MNADINLRLAYGLLDLACTILAPSDLGGQKCLEYDEFTSLRRQLERANQDLHANRLTMTARGKIYEVLDQDYLDRIQEVSHGKNKS